MSDEKRPEPLPPPMEHFYVKRGIGAAPIIIIALGMMVLVVFHIMGAL